MKLCLACHEDLPKDKFSKKQWKLNQRRCKVCVADNREVQPLPPSPPKNNNNGYANNNKANDGAIDRLLESMSINENEMISPSDEELFKQPPPREDCPICFLVMPSMISGRKYNSCCGKMICSGCVHAEKRINGGKLGLCPFCRETPSVIEETIKRAKKRAESGDAIAICNIGGHIANGDYGFPQDYTKAVKFYHRGAKLGCSSGYHNIGHAYQQGLGVEMDMNKARHNWKLAAMLGHVGARNNLAILEEEEGNMDRALKHFMIAVRSGNDVSLNAIKELFMNGIATKEDYTEALRLYQAYLDEVRSDQRDKAAAYSDMYNYY